MRHVLASVFAAAVAATAVSFAAPVRADATGLPPVAPSLPETESVAPSIACRADAPATAPAPADCARCDDPCVRPCPRITLAIGGWVWGLDGTLGAGGREARVESDWTDTLDHLDSLEFALDARLRLEAGRCR